MLNGLDSSSARFLADIGRIQERSARAERQITSGLRVQRASDAPEQIGQILRLRTRVDLNLQTQTNLSRVEAQVNTAEAAMREAVKIVERVRVIAAESATSGALNRVVSGIEVKQLHEQLVAITGISTEGRFVFGGDPVVPAPTVPPTLPAPTAPAPTAPYELDSDPTSLTGVKLTTGAGALTNSVRVADHNQTTFSVFRTASEVFDAPGNANVFKAITALSEALADDDQVAVGDALPQVASALKHLNQQLAFYGNAQNRIASATEAAKKNMVSLRSDLSRLQDTDLTAAILELNASSVHHEAALMAHSKVPTSTLFDYLG